jgi:hypothetical protein
MQALHDDAVTDFEGTGPGGGWDLRGMAEVISLQGDTIELLTERVIELERRFEEQALIAPAPLTHYMPRNRRNDVR